MNNLNIKCISIVIFTIIILRIPLIAQFDFNIEQCDDSAAVIALVDSCLLSNLSADRYKNIQFSGDPHAVGYFYNGYHLGFTIPRGIVLSTGFAEDLDNNNTCSGQNASSYTMGGSDPDLQELINSSINDACLIEFDFKPIEDSIEFSFAFGSEEYHEYVNYGINDGIGMFLSGPGINGTYTNNAMNISLIPGTSNSVSINNINCGPQQNPCTPPPGGNICDMLVDNSIQSASAFYITALDAYTIPIVASYETLPNNWYHIKIVIGDAMDQIYDSGLFLEAGSFFAGLYTHIDGEISINNHYFDVEVYPNPTRNDVNIAVIGEKQLTFEVFIVNMFGDIEKYCKFNHSKEKETYKIDIPNLNSGIYLVKVLTSSGMTRLKKLEVVN